MLNESIKLNKFSRKKKRKKESSIINDVKQGPSEPHSPNLLFEVVCVLVLASIYINKREQ